MRRFVGYEKGVDFGGWLSQCEHTKKHYDSFITEKDFAAVKKWGLDHVRIPVDYNLVEDEKGNFSEDGMAYVQQAIDWCGKYNLNMVLDLHKTLGFSFDKGECESGFFFDEDLQEHFYRLWEELAKRFGKYSSRVAFELLNEITDISYAEKWEKISAECIRRIRKIAPDVYIIVGGYYNNSIEALDSILMPTDDKIVYTFHCYEPLIFTHQGAYWVDNMPGDFRLKFPDKARNYVEQKNKLGLNIADPVENADPDISCADVFDIMFEKAAGLAEERNVPLYCGEYGVIDLADKDSTIAWYKAINSAFDKYAIARCAWCYKKKDFGIIDTSYPEELIKYL